VGAGGLGVGSGLFLGCLTDPVARRLGVELGLVVLLGERRLPPAQGLKMVGQGLRFRLLAGDGVGSGRWNKGPSEERSDADRSA
jgi:hypothetical protein